MAKKYVSWRRVSTKKQGNSGLGLEAQKEIIRYFIEHDGGEWIADYEECYTGTELSGCIELRKAMELAKNESAILIIAKSDRFRNTIEALQVYEEMGDGNIMFCDLPHTDKFTLTLFFAIAEREALLVSIRTKQALAAKQARGEALGARCQKWIDSYNNKTKEQKKSEAMERGKMKNERYVQNRDTQAFLKVLKNVFPDVCTSNDVTEWDWTKINTKGDARDKIIGLMRDYKDLDESGALFHKWNFDLPKEKVVILMRAHLSNIKKTILTYKRNRSLSLSTSPASNN